MKNKTFLAVSLFSFLLAGCGSTSKSGLPGPEFNGHPLQIASTDTYEWDTDKSFALNIAEMSRPAGVGYGLVDVEDPKKLDISRSGNALVSGALGFMAGGLGGTLGYLSMDAQSDEKRDWRPSIITFYDESELDLSNPVQANKVVEEKVGSIVANAFTSVYPNASYEGTVPFYHRSAKASLSVFSGDFCGEARTYGRSDNISYDDIDVNKRMFEIIPPNTTSANVICNMSFTSSVVGNVGGKIAVVSQVGEINDNRYFIEKAAPNIKDALVIFPDVIRYSVWGAKYRDHYFTYEYPVVLKDGKEYLFDANEKSSGIN